MWLHRLKHWHNSLQDGCCVSEELCELLAEKFTLDVYVVAVQKPDEGSSEAFLTATCYAYDGGAGCF